MKDKRERVLEKTKGIGGGVGEWGKEAALW